MIEPFVKAVTMWKEEKTIINFLIKNQQPEIDNVNNRTSIIFFSSCGKIYLTNYILIQKQETIFFKYKIAESISQYQSSNITWNSAIRKLGKQHCCFRWHVAFETRKQYWSVFYSRTSKQN